MAIFSSNASGSPDLVPVFPGKPISSFVYRCGNEYHLDPLEAMLRHEDTIGIVVIDSREATIATVNGTRISIHVTMTSGVGGKHDKGGQSQARFQRLHDEGVRWFQGRVAEKMNEVFLNETIGVTKIIIAGSFCKDELIERKELDYRVKDLVVGTVDAGYDGEPGVREALQRSEGLLQDIEYNRQRNLVQQLMEGIARDGKAVYGINETRDAIVAGRVSMLLLSMTLRPEDARGMELAAERNGATVEWIDDGTEDGMMLVALGGIAGLCRF